MFKYDVMKAFPLPNNDGKGFTAKLSQEIFYQSMTITIKIYS